MKLQSLTLNNIKSFSGTEIFDFSTSESINTVSGKNGSGKTTIFKSIILAQKAFFTEVSNYEYHERAEYDNIFRNYFNANNSYIGLDFIFDDGEIARFVIFCSSKGKNFIKTKFVCTDEHFKRISTFWNLDNPRNLIIYIDSNRNISESDFSNQNIRLDQSDISELTLEYVFNPEKIFFSTYERIMQDYIRERVIPSTPRNDLPHYVAKILIHDILEYLKVSNFSGLDKENQFILQVKNETIKKSKFYDIRDLSSGEKTLFYIYHFICYIKNISMLIIDEPENNLHENMLAKFVSSLSEICEHDEFSELIVTIAKRSGQKVASVENQTKKFYLNHKLSQVFLLTHSKNLVYNNFSYGKNYVVDNGLEIIDYDNVEKKLREIGLSRIINKVLFVEGRTENELLETLLSSYNIKVKPLGGSYEVIDTYNKYLNFHNEVKNVQFCFLIDRDTKTDEEIQAIRAKNELFFDEHFIVMDRHEIENYFLEELMYIKLYSKHSNLYTKIKSLTSEEIRSRIKQIADSNKETVLRKKLQNLNQKSLPN